jgi:hypothetical protein
MQTVYIVESDRRCIHTKQSDSTKQLCWVKLSRTVRKGGHINFYRTRFIVPWISFNGSNFRNHWRFSLHNNSRCLTYVVLHAPPKSEQIGRPNLYRWHTVGEGHSLYRSRGTRSADVKQLYRNHGRLSSIRQLLQTREFSLSSSRIPDLFVRFGVSLRFW